MNPIALINKVLNKGKSQTYVPKLYSANSTDFRINRDLYHINKPGYYL